MKCTKRKILIFSTIGIILSISLCSVLLLYRWGKKGKSVFPLGKNCASGDCTLIPDASKKPARQVCNSKDCFTKENYTLGSSYGRGMCISQDCVLQAAKILRRMDARLDPCEDFYNFSCGTFLSTHALPDGKTSFGVDDLASEEIALKIKSFLEKPDEPKENDALRRVKKLYRTCINVSYIEEHSLDHLKDVLSGKGVGDWPFMKSEWNDCRLDLEWRMAKLNALGVDSFFRLDISYRGDEQQAFAYITIAPPLVPDLCEGDDSNATVALEKATKHMEIVETILSLLQVQNNNTQQDIKDMFLFDFMFCNITKLSRKDTDRSISNQSLQDLINMGPEINWARWRNIIFSELGLNFPHDKFYIHVYGLNNTIESIIELLHNTSSRTLANYLTWKFVFHHLGFLGEPFRRVIEKHHDLYAGKLNKFIGSDRWIPRWQQCIHYAQELMPAALMPPYLNRVLTTDLSREMIYVVSAVKNAFRDIFRKNPALLREEKVISIHKIDQVDVHLYYPDKEMKFFDKYHFEMGTLGDSFLKNGMKAKKNLMRKLMEGISLMKTRYDLEYTMLSVNPFAVHAWSSFLGNKIVIFLGEIESAHISTNLPRFLSMSTLGATMGEALAHGFDFLGIKGLGPQPSNWTIWPNYVVKYVEAKARCLVRTDDNAYNTTDNANDTTEEVPMEVLARERHQRFWNFFWNKVNSLTGGPLRSSSLEQNFFFQWKYPRSVNDDLADNQGVYLAYKAYMNYVSSYGEERYLPALSFTNEQLFFIRYAQTRCEIAEEDPSQRPARQRTNGALMNMEHFAQAFKCPKDSPMNPSKKCKPLWL